MSEVSEKISKIFHVLLVLFSLGAVVNAIVVKCSDDSKDECVECFREEIVVSVEYFEVADNSMVSVNYDDGWVDYFKLLPDVAVNFEPGKKHKICCKFIDAELYVEKVIILPE